MIAQDMPITAVVGEQRGDEGKGRFVDMLMPEHDIGARFGGGANAGHTVVDEQGTEYNLHGLPTSILHENKVSVIGNGAVVNALGLVSEIETLSEQGVEIKEENLKISGQAHLTLPHHILLDEKREESSKAQGSTKSGIGPTYSSKVAREGVTTHIINHNTDALYEAVYYGLRECRGPQSKAEGLGAHEDSQRAKEYVSSAKKIGKYITDTSRYINLELQAGSKVLAEGAQAFLLDIDHGMYPATTSSNTIVGGIATGLGVPIQHHLERTIGVIKAIQSHVGGGPFVTEINNPELLDRLHGDKTTVDAECGTTTGRVRRLGYLDLPQIRRAQMVNGTDEVAITKLDWVPRFGEEVPICVEYERVKNGNNGKIYDMSADTAPKLEQCSPVYEKLPTWDTDIQNLRTFDELPSKAKDYISFIEMELGKRVTYIGVGPARDQVIVR